MNATANRKPIRERKWRNDRKQKELLAYGKEKKRRGKEEEGREEEGRNRKKCRYFLDEGTSCNNFPRASPD
jgi:hypothetical protein